MGGVSGSRDVPAELAIDGSDAGEVVDDKLSDEPAAKVIGKLGAKRVARSSAKPAVKSSAKAAAKSGAQATAKPSTKSSAKAADDDNSSDDFIM